MKTWLPTLLLAGSLVACGSKPAREKTGAGGSSGGQSGAAGAGGQAGSSSGGAGAGAAGTGAGIAGSGSGVAGSGTGGGGGGGAGGAESEKTLPAQRQAPMHMVHDSYAYPTTRLVVKP